jgi:hypothetical protein
MACWNFERPRGLSRNNHVGLYYRPSALKRRNQVDDVILMRIRHLYSLPEGYRRTCAGELLLGRVASMFDMLKNMISVRGSIFTSKYWSSLYYYNSPGAKCRLSTTFRWLSRKPKPMVEQYFATMQISKISSKITAIISAIHS